MKKLLNYLPFHFLLMLIVGIYLQYRIQFWRTEFVFVLLVLTGALVLHRRRLIFPLITGFFFFFLGAFSTFLANPKNHDLFYQNYTTENSSAIVQIGKVLKPNKYAHQYEAFVVQIDSQKTVGTILLSISIDSFRPGFHVDDRIWISSKFREINPPLNPHQFHYQDYLAKCGIYEQVYLNKNEFFQLTPNKSFLGWIASFRKRIQESLRAEGFEEDEFAVMNALLLGQRKEVSKELLSNYVDAGAIHILAISGLHVGILLWMLSLVLKPLEFWKHGKLWKLVFILFALWFFAFLAGMSASVVRAVTMFTAVAIGQSLRRKNKVVYSLVFSMLVLLLFKPMFLFDVGFQLSYLAVYGIVTIQPKLVELWKPKWKLISRFWQLTSVSLAAQLSVLPLSLYYFHQFPGLFLVSNLIIVPFLGIILMLGMLMIIWSFFAQLPEFLVLIYGGIISWLNRVVRFVANQESFLFSDISFSHAKMLVSYLILVFGYQFFSKRSAKRLGYLITSVLLFQLVLIAEIYQAESKSEFVVFNQRKTSIYGIREKGRFFSNLTDHTNVVSYAVGESIEREEMNDTTRFFRWNQQQILIVDSLGIYQLNDLKSPIVILQYSPKINLSRLIQHIEPSLILADASNYKSLVLLWDKTCRKHKTSFWNTNVNGAFVLK